MRRTLVLASSLLLLTGTASAQEGPLGKRGPNVVVFDNLFGVLNYSVTEKIGNNDQTSGLTDVGFLFMAPTLPFAPRLGYHRILDSGLSLGAGFHYSRLYTAANYAFAPRVGFVVPVGASTAIWLRGGVTWARQAAGTIGEEVITQWLVGGEIMLVVTPAPHLGITIGPLAELGISGQREIQSSLGSSAGAEAVDVRARLLGLTMGFLADFLGQRVAATNG